MDMAKYRDVFLEEATEHLAEMSRALLELEKDASRADPIDVIFRMAHSIKGMAASLDYESVTEVAHAMEDRMQRVREAGRVEDDELTFKLSQTDCISDSSIGTKEEALEGKAAINSQRDPSV